MTKLDLITLEKTFLDNLEKEGKSFNTVKNYRTDINIFKTFLAQKGREFNISELTEVQVSEYDTYLNKKYNSPNSIRRRIQALRLFFDFLISKGVFDENPIKKMITRPKVVDPPKPTKFDTIRKLVAYLNNEKLTASDHEVLLIQRNLLIIYLIYGAGLKVSDLENLCEEHISKTKGGFRVLILREKRDPISVTLPKSFEIFYNDYLSVLETAKSKSTIDFKEVLFNANPFKILSGGLSSRGTEVIFKELSTHFDEQITAKSLRQSGIFLWLNKQVPDSRIKEWMGVQPQYSLKPYKDLLLSKPDQYAYKDLTHELS